MEYIEAVSMHEVVWRLLRGHFGDDVKFVRNILHKKTDILESDDFNNNLEDNLIRLGALALCPGSDSPITNLILHKSPKSEWDVGLKFSRYLIGPEDFFNFREINYDMKLSKAVKKYKYNKKVFGLRQDIWCDNFDFTELNGIVLYKIKSDYIVIDGVHRAMAIMSEILNRKGWFPEMKVICLDNEIKVKRRTFFFKKQYVIDD